MKHQLGVRELGYKMTDGEIAYISMVLVLFFAFIVLIGSLSLGQEEQKN